MNTLTAMFAVIPMMFAIGAGGALQAPLAITVFGGLLTSTALTLIVLPVAYELIDELGVKVRAMMRSGEAEAAPESAVQPEAVHAGD